MNRKEVDVSQIAEAQVQGQPYGSPYTADMAKRQILGVEVIRKYFARYLSEAFSGTHLIVFRRSAPVAVIVPPDWYQRASEAIGDPWEDWTPAPKKD